MADQPIRPIVRPPGPDLPQQPANPTAPLSAAPRAAAPVARREERPPAAPAPERNANTAIPSACNAQEELETLIRARYPLIYVVSWEEERVEKALADIALRRNKKLLIWTCTQGIVKPGTEPQRGGKLSGGNTADPLSALDSVLGHVDPAIFLFKDFHPYTDDQRSNIAIIRKLRDVAYHLRDTYKTIVIVSPLLRIAPELMKDVTLMDFGLPGVEDFNKLLDRIIEDVKDKPRIRIDITGEARDRLLQAARGLTLKEAENVFAKTLVLSGKIDAADVQVVFSEKQQIIKKSGLLEYYESKEQLGNVAGLNHLKEWLKKRSLAFSEKARAFGLPYPKGVLLLGVQGCGKSLCAKAASSLWELPLLRLDIGRMFGSLVGSSEENMRRAILTAESIAPVILWVDEIDKAFAGAVGSGDSDAGTASRVFGTFLTWLSEKTAPVFLIATANDISSLPPEMLRKGRVDEIFFVDLPNESERVEVFKIHLERRSRQVKKFDLVRLAKHCDGFSGAEIEEAVVSGLFDAFSKGEDLSTEVLFNSITETVPLSKTMSEDLNRLRGWAKGRARPATSDNSVQGEKRRKIEF